MLNFISNLSQKLKFPKKPISLQFQLTLELVTISVISLGSVAIWAGWQMEQNLVAAHKQTLEYIAMRFPEQLEFYAESDSLETGLEKTITRVSSSNLMVWVRNSQGKLLAQSSSIDDYWSEAQAIEAMDQVPIKPQIVRFNGRDIVLCGTSYLVNIIF